jgi:hypothetical protein
MPVADNGPSRRPGAHARWKSELKRESWLTHFKQFGNVREACEAVDVRMDTYRRWRQRYPEFKSEVDELKRSHKAKHYGVKAELHPEFDNSDWLTAPFEAFRKTFFKMDTPPFQLEIVKAYENTEAGRITMILIPPEHGKTTLFEDYAAWKLATDPSFRFTVGSESQFMSRKILERVKLRMDPDGPFPAFVQAWGPFIPQTQSRRKTTGAGSDSAIRQAWGADFFNVYKKRDHDERDFSMVALGVNSQVAGTRTDHLHLDDVMSMNNVTQAKTVAQKIRQDWLSRPGQRGRTTINGTRVDIGDVYEIFESELSERVLTVVTMKAIVDRGNGPEPLWPWDEETQSGWTMEMLDRQRELVGEQAWQRNYMQEPHAAGDATFTEESIGRCLNPLRSQLQNTTFDEGPIVIGVDPSIGGISGFAVTQFQADKFVLLESKQVTGLTTNAAIFRVVQELIVNWTNRGAVVSDVIIETMAFQKGLIKDQDLIALQNKYGFRALPHLTGKNKYDDDIGVASMASSFMRGEVDLPYADDSVTRFNTNDFKRECLAWRPHIKGSRLRQDRLMAFWFPYIEWRKRTRTGTVERSPKPVKGDGLSWRPTDGRVLGQGGRYDAA